MAGDAPAAPVARSTVASPETKRRSVHDTWMAIGSRSQIRMNVRGFRRGLVARTPLRVIDRRQSDGYPWFTDALAPNVHGVASIAAVGSANLATASASSRRPRTGPSLDHSGPPLGPIRNSGTGCLFVVQPSCKTPLGNAMPVDSDVHNEGVLR
jgi:hypothetical protein